MPSEETPSAEKSDSESVMYDYAVNTDTLEEENQLLRQTVKQLRSEIERYRVPPLMVCELTEKADDGWIIKIPNGNKFFTTASETEDELASGDTVLCEQKNLTILRKISKDKKFNVEQFTIIHKPTVTFADIGGLDEQIRDIQEVIELPLKKPELFKQLGIHPPKGVLLYGEPGTGKTLLAKAVANASDATFIEVVGSELVQKFIGEGAKLIKEMFQLARERAPSVVFIDEIDALASKRIEIGTSGEREVQRTFMQLLAELDGFKPLDNVKIIAATNRKDILDPAIVRPGRFDRLIHIPKPKDDAIKSILEIHTENMQVDDDVSMDRVIERLKSEDFTGAEIRSVCMEAGYLAIREDRTSICYQDFIGGIAKVKRDEEENIPITMFG
jgi:proteasome regulatory subunit